MLDVMIWLSLLDVLGVLNSSARLVWLAQRVHRSEHAPVAPKAD
jgi:hypothetical protein